MGKLAIERPVTVTMLTLFCVALGIAAYCAIPQDLFPRIGKPSLRVIAEYEGASSGDIEEQITRRLEESLAGIKGLTHMSSVSGEERSEILLEFDFDANLDFISTEVREKLDQAQGELPADAKKPTIERWDPSAQAVFVAGVASPDSPELRRNIESDLRLRLERIPGVASVQLTGGVSFEIRARLDRHKLNQYHLSIREVEAAFARENVSLRAGRLADAHSELLVRTVGRVADIEDMRKIVIARRPGNIYLEDLLECERGPDGTIRRDLKGDPLFRLNIAPQAERQRARLKTEGQKDAEPSVQVELYKKQGGDTVEICRQARRILGEYEESARRAFPDLSVAITYDQSSYIADSLRNIQNSAVTGTILSVIVLLVFLRRIESTLIISLSMPVSVIAAFSLFYAVDMGMNLFSMAGLTLAVGMVVDNAIVVIESVYGNRQKLKRLDRAITVSLSEVGPPVFSSTLTTLAVFVPLLFVPGFVGQVFRDLSYTIVFTMIFSLLVAFSLIPMLLHQIVDASFAPLRLANGALDFAIRWIFGVPARAFVGLYKATMRIILSRWSTRLAVIALTCFVFALSLREIPPNEILPDISGREIEIELLCPSEWNLGEKDVSAREVEKILQAEQKIERFTVAVTSQGASFLISLRETDDGIIPKLRAEIAKVPALRGFSLNTVSPLQTIFSQSGKDIAIEVRGPDFERIESLCDKVEKRLRTQQRAISCLADVENSMGKKSLEIRVVVDKESAASHAVTTEAIAREVESAVGGTKVCDIATAKGRLDVQVSIGLSARGEQALAEIPIAGAFPLAAVAEILETQSPVSIFREERQRVGLVWANIRSESGMSLGEVSDLLTNPQRTGVLDEIECPPDCSIALSGASASMNDSFAALYFAMIAAVVLVYMVMAAQFESLVHPFAIMFSLPLAGIGAIWSLRFFELNLSAPAFIGLIMLAGIVVNNAIILIDYINILRARGNDRDEAILIAGETRMRPIFMTTLTTVTGMLPMAIATGSGANIYQPLAVVVIGGLSLATVLTLVFIPMIYCFFDDIREFFDFFWFRVSMFFPSRS